MRALVRIHVVTIAVASSYLTLGVVAPSHARSLWAPYALVTFTLAVLALLMEHYRHDDSRPPQR